MNLFSKLSNVTFQLIGSYLCELQMNPVRTKSLTSCIIGGLGNYLSQRLFGGKFINHDTFWAFVIFGFLFGGTIPHYFYETLSNFLTENSTAPFLQLLLIKRLIFMPVYSFFTLYMLSRLEGKGHENSLDDAQMKFPSVFKANLKYLSLLQYINIFFVHPALKDLFSSLIAFFWTIYLSYKRQ